MLSRSFAVSASTALFLLAAGPASAIEPDEAADALGAALTQGSNVAASYDSAELVEGNVVIEGFSIARNSAEQTVKFDKVVIEAPSEGDEGVFESPKITFTDGTVSGDSKGTIGTIVVTDATILDPAEGKKNGFGGSILFHTADATDIRMAREGEAGEITVGKVSVESGNVVGDVAETSRGSVEDFSFSQDFISGHGLDPKSLGYDAVVFDVTWDGSRDVAAKTMTINDFRVTFHDGGELSVNGVVGNLPDPRVLNDEGGASKASETQVHRLTVRYDDNSLAGRVLDYLATKQGLNRADYVQQISAALPFLLMSINNPAFQQQVTTAVAGFLQDPHSFLIEIAPDSPVSAAEILDLAKSTPGTIPDRLKATVTANAPAQ